MEHCEILVLINLFFAYFLSGKGKDISSDLESSWISCIWLTDNFLVYAILWHTSDFRYVHLWRCVQLISVSWHACLKLLYFVLTLLTVTNSFLSSFLPHYFPISSISLAKLTSSFHFQYLFIWTLIFGSLYSWSQTCLRMSIAVVGWFVNNFLTSIDCQWTNELHFISKLALRGLNFGFFKSPSHTISCTAFCFFAFILSQFLLDLKELNIKWNELTILLWP